jgi:hypothetical protein
MNGAGLSQVFTLQGGKPSRRPEGTRRWEERPLL